MKQARFWIQLLLGLVILGGLVWWARPAHVWDEISGAAPGWVALMAIIWLASLFTGGVGVHALFRSDVPRDAFFLSYVLSQALGSFLPFQMGEMSLMVLLKKRGISMTSSVTAFIVDKLITLAVLSIVGLLALRFFLARGLLSATFQVPAHTGWAILGLLVVGLIAAGFLLGPGEIVGQGSLRAIREKMRKVFDEILAVGTWNRHGLGLNLAVTCARQLLGYPAMIYCLFRAIGVELPFSWVLLTTGTISIISLIPITVQGIGVLEVSAVYLYSLVGIEPGKVISNYLIGRAVNLVLSGGLVALTWTLFNRKPSVSPQ